MESLFGAQNHVDLAQECARAVLIFAYGLVLLRLSGRRTFGHWSALDIVISIIVGSALGRALTGNAPLPGTMAAAAVLVGLHVAVSHEVARSRWVSRLVEGDCINLLKGGRIDHRTRKAHMISQSDLDEALRKRGVAPEESLEKIRAVTLEPSGDITVVKRPA